MDALTRDNLQVGSIAVGCISFLVGVGLVIGLLVPTVGIDIRTVDGKTFVVRTK